MFEQGARMDGLSSAGGVKHTIESAVFDLSLGKGMAEWAGERELCAVVERELLSVVDEVFDETDATPALTRLDTLEIDLGSLSFDGSWSEVRERLRERLRAAMAGARLQPSIGSSERLSTASSNPLGPAALELVSHFLRFGVLPSQARAGEARHLDRLVRGAAHAQPERLANLVRCPLLGEAVATRLVCQFPDRVLEQLAQALRPGSARIPGALLHSLEQILGGSGVGASRDDGIRRVLWSRFLINLAAEPVGSTARAVQHVLESVASSLGRPYGWLLEELVNADTGFAESASLIRWLSLEAGTPLAAGGEAPGGEPVPAATEKRGRFARGPESHDPRSGPGRGDGWDEPVPGWLEAPGRLLEQLRSGDLMLATLCEVLSTADQRRLLEAILGAKSASSVDTAALLAAEQHAARRSSSERTFHRRVLQRLVKDELLDLEAIAAEVAPGEEPEPSAETTEGLAELALVDPASKTAGASAIVGTRQPDAAGRQPMNGGGAEGLQVPSGSQRLFRAYDLYAQLAEPRTGASATASESTPGSGGMVDEIARIHPDQLRRLAFELKHGVLALQAVLARCWSADLRQLTRALLRVTSQSADAGDCAEMLHSLDRHAARAGSEWRFYCQVLERLVADEPVDLELIVATSTTPTDRPGGKETTVPGTVATDHLAESRDAIAESGWRAESDRQHGSCRPDGTAATVLRPEPQYLGGLVAHLRCGDLSPSVLPGSLDPAGHRRLVEGFLASLGERPEELEDLRQAIDTFALRSGNQESFYRGVLEALMSAATIDLEAIAASASTGFADEKVPAPPAPAFSAELGHISQRPLAESAKAEAGQTANSNRPPSAGEDVLEAYLTGGALVAGVSRRHLMHTSEHLLVLAPARYAALLRRSLQGGEAITRLVAVLPERLLTRALFHLAPAAHERVQRYGDAVANACHAAVKGIRSELVAGLKWRLCFQFALEPIAQPKASLFEQRFMDLLADHSVHADLDQLRALIRARLDEADQSVGGDGGTWSAQPPAFVGPPREPFGFESARGTARRDPHTALTTLLEQGVRIGNAGQVLAAPFLPRLFSVLGLLEDGAFVTEAARERAVHLLQYMVDGATDRLECELILNKVLCGWDAATPIGRGIVVANSEREAIGGMLRSMIQHWQALKQTSVSGFRESFLQREGTLRLQRDGWQLAVEPRPFDMLLDRIPWGFSVIKQSWMDRVIYVDWR